MLKRLSPRERFEQLVSSFSPLLRAAFVEAIDDIRSNIVLRRVVERLEKGDVNGAIEAMHLDADAFAKLELAIAEAYNAGGAATVENLPRVTDPEGNRVVFRFGVRNPEAEAWLRVHSSTLVTRIVDDQREAIRAALTEGLARGDNPRRTALDVVGRVSRTSNRREGGIIGLTAAQESYVARARQELLSGDAEAMAHYLTRGRRDKRFDRAVTKALNDGKPLPRETVDRIVGRYSDRLLDLRGEMLARTETMTSLGKSRDDAIRQQIAAGKIDAADVTKHWRSAGDNRVRHTHRILNGKTAPMDGFFASPSGAMLRYPGDPNAPVSEVSGCRCWMEYKIDYMRKVAERDQLREEMPRFLENDEAALSLIAKQPEGREHLVGYDQRSGKSFALVSGEPDRVQLSAEMREAVSDPKSRVVLHHNHPAGQSLSRSDIGLLGLRPGLSRIYAHTPDGSVFTARRRDEIDMKRYDAIDSVLASELGKMVKRGGVSAEVARVYAHLLNRILAQLDILDYGATLRSGTEMLYTSYRSELDELVDRISQRFT